MSKSIWSGVAAASLTAAFVGGIFAIPNAASNQAVATTVTANTPAQTDIAPMTDAGRAQLQGEMRRYLLENPDIVVEVIQLLEAQREVASLESEIDMVRNNADALRNDGFSYVGGNPDGDITLVEFLDYQCGFCKRAHAEVKTLVEMDGNIRYIVKEYPILGPQSELASRAAMAVLNGQGSDLYAVFHDSLMTFGGQVTEVTLARLAERSGVDASQMISDMGSPEVAAQINAVRELGRTLEITGTPSFVFGDKMVRGYLPLPQMQEVVAELRAAQ